MSSDYKPVQESSTLKPPKWISALTAGTLSLIAVALLQRFGDSVFDTLQSALGKRLAVQAIALLLVLLGYFAWLLLRHPRVRHLDRRRALYWAHGDMTPFCPCCYEVDNKQHHLSGPVPLLGGKDEFCQCHVCHRNFLAALGMDFVIHETGVSIQQSVLKGKR